MNIRPPAQSRHMVGEQYIVSPGIIYCGSVLHDNLGLFLPWLSGQATLWFPLGPVNPLS